MKKTVSLWQMGGFVFTAVVGTLLHFLFDWTGGSPAAALVSAVNESIWEHLKLLFYPMAAVAVAEYFVWGKEEKSFWCIKLLGSFIGLILIPTAYYTYTGALGIKADWVNIVLFFLTAAMVYYVETKWFQKGVACRLSMGTAVCVLCILGAVFSVFTFLPPHIPIFQDPLSGAYGFWRRF